MSVEIPVRPDEFLLNLLEDDRDVQCTAFDDDDERCPAPARWAVRCAACGLDYQHCDRHRAMADRHPLARLVGWRCSCGARLRSPLPWRPL